MVPPLDVPSFRSLRRGIAVCLGAALFARVSPAGAEPDPKPYPACGHSPTETDIGAAKGAFQAGNASFDEADYARAIVYWEDAYRRDCTAHALLLNLARAYELHGDKRQAVLALETYLVRAPDGPDRDKIERRIDVLKTQIETERVPAETPAPAPVAKAEPARPPQVQAEAAPSAEAPVEPPTTPRARGSIVPLIVAGAGGAIAIGGGILYAVGWSDLKEVERACGGRECTTRELEASGDDARDRVNIGGGVAIGGLLIAGGGLAWYFLDRQKSSAATTGLAPVAAPGFWGLSYRGRL